MPITLFNPFSLKNVTDHFNQREHIQEVIDYAESRFWTILKETRDTDSDRKKWTQILLHRELVCRLRSIFGI